MQKDKEVTPQRTEKRVLKLAMIGYDPEYYPRVHGANWQTVLRYEDAMRGHLAQKLTLTDVWPALVVAKTKDGHYILLDGYHRWRALRKLGVTEFMCEIRTGLPEGEWLATATSLNADSKRPLSKYDMIDVALRLEQIGKNRTTIAVILQIPPTRLQDWFARSTTKPDDGARPEALKSPYERTASAPARKSAPVHQGPVHSARALGVLRALQGLLLDKAVDVDDDDTREAALEVRDLLLKLLPLRKGKVKA